VVGCPDEEEEEEGEDKHPYPRNCQINQNRLKNTTHVLCKNRNWYVSENGINGTFRTLIKPTDPSNLPAYKFGGTSFFQDAGDMYEVVSRCDHSSGKCNSGTRKVFVYRLNEEWTDYQQSINVLAAWWPCVRREAPFIFRQEGVFYVASSQTAGWRDSYTKFRRATTLAGLADANDEEVVMLPSPTSNKIKSMGSQFRFFIEVGPGKWLFGGNRYPDNDSEEWDGKYGRYVMTPVRFISGVPHVYWKEQFQWDSYNYASGDYDDHDHNGYGHAPNPTSPPDSLTGYTWEDGKDKFANVMEKAYTTDFLTDRAIDFIKEQKKQNRAFTLMLSLPDPHGKLPVQGPQMSILRVMVLILTHALYRS